MSTDLASLKCIPCRGDVPALAPEEIAPLLSRIDGWRVEEHSRLRKEFGFEDFMGAVRFLNAVADIAEAEGHHPDLLVRWGAVDATIFTHKVNGLTESDFILAAKMDRQYGAGSGKEEGT